MGITLEDKRIETYASEGSGTYVRVSISDPTLTGGRNSNWLVKFWASSSSVNNSDGNDVGIQYSFDGGASIASTYTMKTIYGRLVNWQGTYTLTQASNRPTVYMRAFTKDRTNDSRFYAVTGWVKINEGSISADVKSSNETSTTVNFRHLQFHGEDLSYTNHAGTWVQYALNNSSPTAASTVAINIALNRNQARSMSYSLVPNGIAGPGCWTAKSINVATTFSTMSMPTMTATRQADNPANVVVTWTAGGTTNKPSGNASRTPYLIVRRQSDMSGSGNISVATGINFESSGSYTFTGLPVDVPFTVFMEYNVSGLIGSPHYQKSNLVVFDAAFSARVKVGGVYKTSSNGYIKVGGSYKKITEGFVKVGGKYKRMV